MMGASSSQRIYQLRADSLPVVFGASGLPKRPPTTLKPRFKATDSRKVDLPEPLSPAISVTGCEKRMPPRVLRCLISGSFQAHGESMRWQRNQQEQPGLVSGEAVACPGCTPALKPDAPPVWSQLRQNMGTAPRLPAAARDGKEI